MTSRVLIQLGKKKMRRLRREEAARSVGKPVPRRKSYSSRIVKQQAIVLLRFLESQLGNLGWSWRTKKQPLLLSRDEAAAGLGHVEVSTSSSSSSSASSSTSSSSSPTSAA